MVSVIDDIAAISTSRACYALLAPPAGKCCLYRIFAGSDLLYVGISANPAARFMKHKRTDWWRHATRITFDVFESEWVALDAERAAIKAERPRHNKRSAVRAEGGV